ncbi:hypothetical protein [Cryptosporangium aurantiacum]|uniref:Uncharacterized protein n=1 Tax=Cryptosporangium aurantiacum TaxID=134849 RepID=A0A1M7REF9_9ACTN|nr:hypothetical protein [Cryptosporangium aurantiacum]SHN44606.1 hypothetical protein SAMN05443668_110274 [Cryptosporangium aurantiacum]
MSRQAPIDPEWTDYLAAVNQLANLPNLADERRRSAKADEETAIARAKGAQELALKACDDWLVYAKRTLSNAEARLVAAHILVPDASAAPTIAYDSPEPLVEGLAELDKKLATEVAGLNEARRAGRARAMERAAEAARKAALRKELLRIGGIIVLIILGALLLRVIF